MRLVKFYLIRTVIVESLLTDDVVFDLLAL
jgi:hypothetical protein